MVGKLIEVKCESVIVSANNPRTVNTSSESFADLVESIKGDGVIVPLHVRDSPAADGMYELLAGERRYKAAEKAGLKIVPVIKHGRLSDDEAFAITFAENFAREELTVTEQSKAVGMMLEKFGGDIDTVASKIGQSANWVAMRAKIHDGVVKEVLDDIDSGFSETWTAKHLARIARLPEASQVRLVELGIIQDEAPSVKELEGQIGRVFHIIKSAPWDISAKLKKGSSSMRCSTCSDATDYQPILFGDMTDTDGPSCTNIQCWDERMTQHLKNKAAALKVEHGKVCFIATEYMRYYERDEINSRYGNQFLDQHEYESAKKKDDDSLCGLVVWGKSLGGTRWIRLKSSGRKSAAGKAGSTTVTPGKPLKEKRAELKSKRWQQVLRDMVVAVDKSVFDQIVHPDQAWFVIQAAAYFGTDSPKLSWKLEYKKFNADAKNMMSTASEAEMDETLDSLWLIVRPVLSDLIKYNGPITQVPDVKIKEAKMMAVHLGIDIDAMFEKAVTDIPEPKSWAKQKSATKSKKKTA